MKSLLLFLSLTLSLFAQNTPEVKVEVDVPIEITEEGDSGTFISPSAMQEPDTMVLSFAEINPQFPGGDTALKKYINDSLRIPATEFPLLYTLTNVCFRLMPFPLSTFAPQTVKVHKTLLMK